MTDSLLSVRAAAARLGISLMTARRLIKRGYVRGVHVGKRVLVPESEIARIVATGCGNGETLLASKREAAAALGLSVRTVERMIRDGEIPCVRVRGSVKIPVGALHSFAKGPRHAGVGTVPAS
jgi:excisionase family DNA binding protein